MCVCMCVYVRGVLYVYEGERASVGVGVSGRDVPLTCRSESGDLLYLCDLLYVCDLLYSCDLLYLCDLL